MRVLPSGENTMAYSSSRLPRNVVTLQALSGIPKFDQMVPATGSERLVIRREGQASDPSGMIGQHRNLASRIKIPNPYRLVPTC